MGLTSKLTIRIITAWITVEEIYAYVQMVRTNTIGKRPEAQANSREFIGIDSAVVGRLESVLVEKKNASDYLG